MDALVTHPGTSEDPAETAPDDDDIDYPTADQLGYDDHDVEISLPEWGDGNVVQFGGSEGIALDRNAEIDVVDVRDWA